MNHSRRSTTTVIRDGVREVEVAVVVLVRCERQRAVFVQAHHAFTVNSHWRANSNRFAINMGDVDQVAVQVVVIRQWI